METHARAHRRAPWLRAVTLGAAVVLTAVLPASGQEVLLRGEVSQILGFALEDGPPSEENGLRWTAGQVAVNRTRYRLELERRFGYDAAGVVAFKGRFDATAAVLEQVAEATDGQIPLVELDQAYVDLYSESTDFRLGRQKVAWGTADGFNPTSYFAPLNVDLAGGGLGALIAPVTALRSATYFNLGTLVAVVVPTFERRAESDVVSSFRRAAREVAEARSLTWAGTDDEVKEKLDVEPANQGEIGVQFDTFFRGTSLYVSYFNGYEDQPAVWLTQEAGEVKVGGARWRRQQQMGLAVAATWRGFTLWGEAAYTLPERLEGVGEADALSPAGPYLQGVVGGDYRLGDRLRVELQYIHHGPGSILRIYQPASAEAGRYLMAMASFAPAAGHSLELLLLDGLRDDSAVWIPTYRYKLTQTTEASASVMLVNGSAASDFGKAGITDGDRVTLAVTVRF